MARPTGRDVPTARTRMHTGETLAQVIRRLSGRSSARVRGSSTRFTRASGGTVPFSLEDVVRTDIIKALNWGTRDAIYLDQFIDKDATVNPFQRLGYNLTADELREIIRLYETEGLDYYNPDDDPNNTGNFVPERFTERPNANQFIGAGGTHVPMDPDDSQLQGYTATAPLSEIPTSTTNAARPRTIAAGYQIEEGKTLGKISVVFRDGTYYNYYNVDPKTWDAFRAAESKGRFIYDNLDGGSRGRATTANLDPDVRSEIVRIGTTVQRAKANKKGQFKPASKRIRGQRTKSATPGQNPARRSTARRRNTR